MSDEFEDFASLIGGLITVTRHIAQPADKELKLYCDRLIRLAKQHQAVWGELHASGFYGKLPVSNRAELRSALDFVRGKVAVAEPSILDLSEVFVRSHEAFRTLSALPGKPTIGPPKPPPPPPPRRKWQG